MAFLGYNYLGQNNPRQQNPWSGLPRPINQVPGGMQQLGYNLPRRDDEFGNPRFEPWYKPPVGPQLAAHNKNVDQQWAPWFGGRALSADERRMVNPPAFTAPRNRFSREQKWQPKPGDYMKGDVNATGRPIRSGPTGGQITPRPSGRGRWVSGRGTVSKRDEFTPEMENVRNELFQLGYPNLTGDVDFNPQWGTTGGIGYDRLGAAPPVVTEEEERARQARSGGSSLGDEVFGREQLGGMATGDPAGRQQQSGQALGEPITDLSGFMSWLGNDNQQIKNLYDEFVRNGWELPDGWLGGYRAIMDKGGGQRNANLERYVLDMLLAAKGEHGREQPDPTQTDPELDNVFQLDDRDQSEGTGFPWAQDIPSPFSQDAPPWAQQWVDQMGTLMPQITDQYRAIANLGIYGPAGMQTIRAPLQNATNRVLGSLEPFINETTQGIRQSEANQRRRAGQALQGSLGRLGAQRPGAAAQSIATNITAPSMMAESDRIFDARQGAKGIADSLIMNQGQFDTALTERNMASKAGVGLPGMQGAIAQQAGLLQQRPWDFSMENKFGWAPERSGEIQMRVQDFLMSKGYSMDWNMAQLGAQLGDWGSARSQQRQFEFQSMLMELKQKYDKEMEELFGDDWFDKLMGGAKAYKDIRTAGGRNG